MQNNNSIRELYLAENRLKSFNIRDNNSINLLNLAFNQLSQFSINTNQSVTSLFLWKNKLRDVSLRNNTSIKILKLHLNEELDNVNYLPPSLEVLWFSRNKIVSYNFDILVKMKELNIFSKKDGTKVSRRDMINLREGVQFKGDADAKW